METFIGDTITIYMATGIDMAGLQARILYRKPDGTSSIWVAAVDPLDTTRIYYTTVASDLDQDGTWKLQVFVESSTIKLHGQVVDLIVHEYITLP